MNIVQLRLENQHLIQYGFPEPTDVVRHLGAVQSQDYAAAKWALGIRMEGVTDHDIEKAYDEGVILRTHVMRPTWHFVLPENIRWMLELTAPRVKAFMAHYNRKLELDDVVFKKTHSIITKVLQDHTYLTRQELKRFLDKEKIISSIQRLAHIMMWAELDGLICSGPRRGKQFTYALLDERVQATKKVTQDEALAKLALLYFTGHGPAQLKDFAWWSGLTITESTVGINSIISHLTQETHRGKTYWFSQNVVTAKPVPPTAHLLSIYDEYIIAYKDRTDMSMQGDIERMIAMGNALTSVIVIDGLVVGTWKRVIKKQTVEIYLNPFSAPSTAQRKALDAAAHKLGTYLQLVPDIHYA